MQARLSATFEGAPSSPAAGGGAVAAALAASVSAFSAASASRTSLVAAPRSGCCSCSLASSGLKPRSGSATRSPRTASRRASGVLGSLMPKARPEVVATRAVLGKGSRRPASQLLSFARCTRRRHESAAKFEAGVQAYASIEREAFRCYHPKHRASSPRAPAR
eukprot:scaffold96712_cov56-Phaeocystis_antarctica.AAC.2